MSQKTARIARIQHECDVCSGVILPGHIYLNEHGQRSSYDLRFVNKHTCAACVNEAAVSVETRLCTSAFHHGKHSGRCQICNGWCQSPRQVAT